MLINFTHEVLPTYMANMLRAAKKKSCQIELRKLVNYVQQEKYRNLDFYFLEKV